MINAIEKKKSRLKNKAEGHFEKGLVVRKAALKEVRVSRLGI